MKVDVIFQDTLKDILENGCDTSDRPARPVWEDGSTAYTIKQFGVVHTYDLREEFPIPTIRPIPLKNCIDEILWIWQKKSNDIKDLRSHIWDSWAGEDGTIGKAYGYQVGHKFRDGLDQTDYILNQLKTNPYSRRIIGNLYEINDLSEMNLDPCCYSITLNVTGNTVHMILNQRSADLITAGFWNVFQYAVLLKMFAKSTGLIAGKLIHVIADAHIYDRHIDIAKELISREPYDGAEFWINPEKIGFYDFTLDDFDILNYKHHDQIKNIPVAV